jgi:cell division protein FtsN
MLGRSAKRLIKKNMKTIIMTIVVVGVVATLVLYKTNNEPISYVKEHTVEVLKEAPKEPWMLDEDAVRAAQDVIKKKEIQAEISTLEAVQASTTEKLKTLRKELDSY